MSLSKRSRTTFTGFFEKLVLKTASPSAPLVKWTGSVHRVATQLLPAAFAKSALSREIQAAASERTIEQFAVVVLFTSCASRWQWMLHFKTCNGGTERLFSQSVSVGDRRIR